MNLSFSFFFGIFADFVRWNLRVFGGFSLVLWFQLCRHDKILLVFNGSRLKLSTAVLESSKTCIYGDGLRDIRTNGKMMKKYQNFLLNSRQKFVLIIIINQQFTRFSFSNTFLSKYLKMSRKYQKFIRAKIHKSRRCKNVSLLYYNLWRMYFKKKRLVIKTEFSSKKYRL